jgi:hypothetical protein
MRWQTAHIDIASVLPCIINYEIPNGAIDIVDLYET